jgi:putative ABC transport system permease protein
MAESSSQITFENVRQTKFLDGIARDEKGEPIASAEIMVLITVPRANGSKAHVQVRGLSPMGWRLRPQVRFVEGTPFQAGRRECVVSKNLAKRFPDLALGKRFQSGKHTWTVVGIFDAGKTAYDSEVWVDADEARAAFNRTFYGSILLRPASDAAVVALKKRIEGDKQMQLRVLTESEYYAEQTKTAAPIRIFGAALAVIMSIGAAFSTMNAMYASVGARFREIGTLRALGFRRTSIYLAFMIESLVIAIAGGVLGCALSLPMHGVATGTFNWSTFAEVAFEFRITIELLAAGFAFAIVMGLLGGLLPARLAARMPLLQALRAT